MKKEKEDGKVVRGVYLDNAIDKKVKEMAEKEDRTISNVLSQIIKRYFKGEIYDSKKKNT